MRKTRGLSTIVYMDGNQKNGIGPAVAEWRKSVDMTQQGLANALGMSISFIGQMEIGRKNPSMEMVVQIVMFLNKRRAEWNLEPIDLNEALSLAGYPAIAAPQRLMEAVQIINGLSTSKLRTAILLLKALSDEENGVAT